MKNDIEYKFERELEIALQDTPLLLRDYIFRLDISSSITTRIAYTRDLKHFLSYLSTEVTNVDLRHISVENLDPLTQRDIEDYLIYCKSYIKNINGKTKIIKNNRNSISRKLSALKKFFRYLYKNKLISNDPTYLIEVKTTNNSKINNRLDDDEINTLLNCIKLGVGPMSNLEVSAYNRLWIRDYTIVSLLVTTGIRISELTSLDINDINLKKKRISITTKGGDIDLLPYPTLMHNILINYIEYRKTVKAKENFKQALFLSQFKKRIDNKTVRVLLKKYINRTTISEDVTPHSLRRTYLTNIYNRTGDIELVRRLGHHNSIETTRKYYAAINEDRVTKVVKDFKY